MEIYKQELDTKGLPIGNLYKPEIFSPEKALARLKEVKSLIEIKNGMIASAMEELAKQRVEKELYVAERDELKLKLGKE